MTAGKGTKPLTAVHGIVNGYFCDKASILFIVTIVHHKVSLIPALIPVK